MTYYYLSDMDFKTYQEKTKVDMPPLLANGDSFSKISSIEVKTIDYQGTPTEVANIETDKGKFGTFSGVVIKALKEYFATNTEPLTNVRIVQPRGKKYLALEGF